MNPLTFFAVLVISLSSGMMVYRSGLFWYLHRPFPYRDWASYGPFYLAFLLAVILVYLPVFRWLQNRLNGTRPPLVFALAGALLSMVPTYGLKVLGDARLEQATSPEALVIWATFVTAGFVFGWFYPGMCREYEEEM